MSTIDKLISIYAFNQPYYIAATQHSDIATVYLTIDHFHKKFSIRPKMPHVGDIGYQELRMSNFNIIEDIAITYSDISTDFNLSIALQACIFRATLFATEILELAKPKEIEAAKRLFIDDSRLTLHDSRL